MKSLQNLSDKAAISLSVLCTIHCLLIATNVYASEKPEHEHKHEHNLKHGHEEKKEPIQHGSHEHGAARLAIAKTDTGMEVTLETPAANFFGFEHKPNSEEEHKVVHSATEKLKAGETLFIANKSANCQLEDVDIDSNLISSHTKEKHDEHDHDRHKHEENKAEQEKHDDHSYNGRDEHDHDKHEHEKKGTHSDVDVMWVFKCEKAASLESVETRLFSQFPNGFDNLNVEWITNDAADTTKLKADSVVKFSQ